MPLYTTTSNTRGIQPDDFGPLVVQPTIDQAVAAKVSRAAWVAEGAEITPSDPTLDEITVTPAKVAGLTALRIYAWVWVRG